MSHHSPAELVSILVSWAILPIRMPLAKGWKFLWVVLPNSCGKWVSQWVWGESMRVCLLPSLLSKLLLSLPMLLFSIFTILAYFLSSFYLQFGKAPKRPCLNRIGLDCGNNVSLPILPMHFYGFYMAINTQIWQDLHLCRSAWLDSGVQEPLERSFNFGNLAVTFNSAGLFSSHHKYTRFGGDIVISFPPCRYSYLWSSLRWRDWTAKPARRGIVKDMSTKTIHHPLNANQDVV